MFHVQLIVPYDSAVIQGYNNVSVRADHRNMVRFLSPEKDAGCAQFFGMLRRWEPLAAERVAFSGLSVEIIERYQRQCLASLAFSDMLYRKSDILLPLQDTCHWIFEDKVYIQWASTATTRLETEDGSDAVDETADAKEDGSDLLLISGKPGSGKSTLMKNLFTQHTERQRSMDGCCLSFFFNARGSGLEKSSLGFYRSLLFQLLRSDSKILRILLPALREKEAVNGSREFGWRQSEVAEQFHKLLRDERVQNVTIFIDGMDECEDYDAGHDIVTSLERSLEISRKRATNLRVCISSRPYRKIVPKCALEIQVEARNSQDIMLYVDRELFLHNCEGHEIKATMTSKASGVFLWVSLVIKRLRTAWDKGCLTVQVKRILDELPPKLEDLYLHITKSITEEQLNTSSRIAQLVLYSKDSLSANDLHSILALTDELSERSLLDISSAAPTNTHRIERFRAFLTEITGGLFEISTASSTNIVQVIHETARDFLRKLGDFNEEQIQEIKYPAIRNYATSLEI